MTVGCINDVHGDAQYLPGDQYDYSGGENVKNGHIGRLMLVEDVQIEV